MTGKRRLLTSHRHVSDGLTVTRCPLLSGTVPTAFLVDNLLGRTTFPGPQHPVPGSPKRHGNDVTRTQRARARARGAGGGACGGRGGAGTRLTEAALGAAVGRRRSRGSGSEGRGLRRRVPSRSGTAAAVSGRALTPDRSVPPLTRAGGRGGPGRQSPALGLSTSAEFFTARRDSGSREDTLPGCPLPLGSHPSPELRLQPGGSHPEPAWVSGMVRAAVARGFEYL